MEVLEITEFKASALNEKQLTAHDDELNKLASIIDKDWNYDRRWDEYEEGFKEINRASSIIGCERRFRKKPSMTKHDGGGDLMTFEEFVADCDGGGFIDYDGYGYYSTEKEESDIVVSPSDITNGKYRKDFTHVCWYNK